jgi:hypothetical protein
VTSQALHNEASFSEKETRFPAPRVSGADRKVPLNPRVVIAAREQGEQAYLQNPCGNHPPRLEMTGTHSHDVRFLGVALAREGRAHGPLLGGPQRLEDRELPPGRTLGPLQADRDRR